MKTCSKCKIEKPETEFHKRKQCVSGKIYYGIRSICKKCQCEDVNRIRKAQTLKNAKFCKCGKRLNNGMSVNVGLCKECYKPIAEMNKRLYNVQYMRKKRGFANIQRNPIKHLSDKELREYLTKQHNRMWWELKDSVIRTHICKRTDLKAKDIPQELVELKKAMMLLKRKLKTQIK